MYAVAALCLGLCACGGLDPGRPFADASPELAPTLLVAFEGSMTSYDRGSGEERSGQVQGVASPGAPQLLGDGTALVTLAGTDELLALDVHTMVELERLPSSGGSGRRPTAAYLAPDGRTFVALHDGVQSMSITSTARFFTLAGDRVAPAAETELGIGHHEAAFSAARRRLVVTSGSDCARPVLVLDFARWRDLETVAAFPADELGFDGSTPALTCNGLSGNTPAPGGCATARAAGLVGCSLPRTGGVALIDVDAESPSLTALVDTAGSGGGAVAAHPDGRHLFVLQAFPRGGLLNPAARCQIGQLVVVDAVTRDVTELPLFYRLGCTGTLAGTDEESAEPARLHVTPDGQRLFVTVTGGGAAGRARVELAVDVADPGAPIQLASIDVGASTGDHPAVLTGDGRALLVANNVAETVSEIDTATGTVTRTIALAGTPLSLAAYGTDEGPSARDGAVP